MRALGELPELSNQEEVLLVFPYKKGFAANSLAVPSSSRCGGFLASLLKYLQPTEPELEPLLRMEWKL